MIIGYIVDHIHVKGHMHAHALLGGTSYHRAQRGPREPRQSTAGARFRPGLHQRVGKELASQSDGQIRKVCRLLRQSICCSHYKQFLHAHGLFAFTSQCLYPFIILFNFSSTNQARPHAPNLAPFNRVFEIGTERIAANETNHRHPVAVNNIARHRYLRLLWTEVGEGNDAATVRLTSGSDVVEVEGDFDFRNALKNAEVIKIGGAVSE